MSGVLSMILGIACFAAADAIGKWVVTDYSVFQVLAVRSVLAVLILLLLAPVFGGREVVRTRQPAAHVARALSSTLAFLFFFASVRVLPLADAVAVEFGGPFIVMALSVPLLGAPVDRGRWIAERRGGAERTFTFLVYTMSVQGLVGLLGAFWAWNKMSGFDFALTSAMGVFALGGQLGVTAAFQRAPASVVAPFEYTALVWATFFGLVIYGVFPKPAVWMGVAIIVGAGLYTLRREGATP